MRETLPVFICIRIDLFQFWIVNFSFSGPTQFRLRLMEYAKLWSFTKH